MLEFLPHQDEEIDHEHDFESEIVKDYNSVIIDSEEDKRHDIVEGETLNEKGRDLILEAISDPKFKDESFVYGRLPAESVNEEAVAVFGLVQDGGVGEHIPLGGVLHLVDGGHCVFLVDWIQSYNS